MESQSDHLLDSLMFLSMIFLQYFSANGFRVTIQVKRVDITNEIEHENEGN